MKLVISITTLFLVFSMNVFSEEGTYEYSYVGENIKLKAIAFKIK